MLPPLNINASYGVCEVTIREYAGLSAAPPMADPSPDRAIPTASAQPTRGPRSYIFSYPGKPIIAYISGKLGSLAHWVQLDSLLRT